MSLHQGCAHCGPSPGLSLLGTHGPPQGTALAAAPLLRGSFVLGDFRNAVAGAAAWCWGFRRGANLGLPPRLRASAADEVRLQFLWQ